MANISRKSWNKYIADLRKISDKAADDIRLYLQRYDYSTPEGMRDLIDYAYAVATKYGEGATALVCEMYDALALLAGEILPAAEPAATATYGEVAKAMYGTRSQNPEVTSGAIGRAVKMAGIDTMMKNALRDGAEWAWIPSGDTCAFCIALSSRGWQKASKSAIKNGHAEHVHANCDCTYAVRFDKNTNVEGYDPEEYADMYYGAEGDTPKERINAMRREFYAENKNRINQQKREAYAARKDMEETVIE